MFKLLQVNVVANWGSTGKIAEQIGVCAMSHDWDSYIAYGRNMNPSKNKLVKIGSMFDVFCHYTENLFLDNEGLASRYATRNFIKQISEIKPNIIHLHNIHDHYLNYRILFEYIAEKKIPVVWTQHDQWAITGHCMYNFDDCDKWQSECCMCPLSRWYSLDLSSRNHRLKKILMSEIPSLTIVPVSKWLEEKISQSHLKRRPIKLIHNGIDIDVFSPQNIDVHDRLGIDKKRKIILGVAAVWDERKGLKDFYELSKRLDSDKYVIVIVGKIIKKLDNIEKGCQMFFVNRTQNVIELAQYYSSAAVYVNPTYKDNFPTTNLEAMACGTPVVTYNTGGSPEAIDENTGVVVEKGDIDALINAIQSLERKEFFSTACRKRVEENFDKNKCFEEYIRLYESLIL